MPNSRPVGTLADHNRNWMDRLALLLQHQHGDAMKVPEFYGRLSIEVIYQRGRIVGADVNLARQIRESPHGKS